MRLVLELLFIVNVCAVRFLNYSGLPSDPFVLPSLENGYIGHVVASNALYLSGTYNGLGTIAPSHRARIPFFLLFGTRDGNITVSSRDVGASSFVQRYSNGLVIRQYAHMSRKNIYVLEVLKEGNCVEVEVVEKDVPPSDDLYTLQNEPGWFVGRTITPEYPQFKPDIVAVAYTPLKARVSCNGALFIMSISNNKTESQEELDRAVEAGSETLWKEHEEEWSTILQSRIEVKANDGGKLAAAINASLSSLLSAVRLDWPKGLSVGGVGTNGKYHGHVFSDAETWMGPVLVALYPSLVRDAILKYRYNLRKGAVAKAITYPYKGTMYPWESAEYGNETCPISANTGRYEQHITGDVGLACRRYWRFTHDLKWLKEEGFEMMINIAAFWASRVDKNGNINGVISMDERTSQYHNISNAVYTNVVAKASLEFADDVARVLNISLCSNFTQIASKIPVVFDESLQIHLPWEGYNGSFGGLPVLMLSFPAMYPMNRTVLLNDFLFYSPMRSTSKYTPKGMAQAMMAVIGLSVNELTDSLNYFEQVYEDFTFPFLVPIELSKELGYGQQNFITSCGGFLQVILYGFCGLRVTATSMEINNPLLPPKTEELVIRGLHYRCSVFDLLMNETNVVLHLKKDCSPLLIRQNGRKWIMPQKAELVLERASFVVEQT